MKYAYYPGCSLGSTAKPYDVSSRAIAEALGLELEEVDDWNCCGASEYPAIDKMAGYALVGRNLARAANQDGFEKIVAPCSLCYLNLKKVDHQMGKYPKVNKQVNTALAAGGLSYEAGSLTPTHLLDAVITDVGLEKIEERVTHPLTGLRIAPYYGCLIVRPEFDEDGFDNTEYPMKLDYLMERLGATVVDFPMKAHCCGGHMTQISSDTAYELIRRILHNASEYEADLIVTTCPMCQLNLDAYQSQVNRHFGTDYKIPILYFSQLVGLAMGLQPKELGIGSEIVSASAALKKVGTEIETEAAPARRRRDDTSLPMPGSRREG